MAGGGSDHNFGIILRIQYQEISSLRSAKTYQSAEFGVEFAMSVVVATMTILLRVQSLTDWQI